MSGQVFLGLTSTKQRIKCLAHGHNAVPPVRLKQQPLDPESSTLPIIIIILLFQIYIAPLSYVHTFKSALHKIH